MGGDICRLCPEHTIADGNGQECWACPAGKWRTVMHCDNFFSKAYYGGECGKGRLLKNIRGRLFECTEPKKGVRRRMQNVVF